MGSAVNDDSNTSGFGLAQAEAVVAEADFERIAQRCKANQFDWLAFEQAHFHKALHQTAAAADRRDTAVLSRTQLVESGH